MSATAKPLKKELETQRREVVARWLKIYAAHYGHTLDADEVTAIQKSLGEFSPAQLEAAFLKTMEERKEFFPTLGQIRGAIGADTSGPRAKPDCGVCSGTGWKTVERDGHRYAERCSCVT